MVMSTMPIKYAVPAGSAQTRVLTALAARYTGCTVRGWDGLDGLDIHPASQNSGRFGYSFGKTRVIGRRPLKSVGGPTKSKTYTQPCEQIRLKKSGVSQPGYA